jgi:hypothetical protein
MKGNTVTGRSRPELPPKPLPALRPAKLAWVAAILDQKGRISRIPNQQRATPQIVLRVTSANLAVVNHLCALTGSTEDRKLRRTKKAWMRRGCTTHCPEPDIEYPGTGDYPEYGCWSVTGAALIIVEWNVRKYMISGKDIRAAAREAEENLVTTGRGVGMVRHTMLRYEYLGWRIPAILGEAVVPPKCTVCGGIDGQPPDVHKPSCALAA